MNYNNNNNVLYLICIKLFHLKVEVHFSPIIKYEILSQQG